MDLLICHSSRISGDSKCCAYIWRWKWTNEHRNYVWESCEYIYYYDAPTLWLIHSGSAATDAIHNVVYTITMNLNDYNIVQCNSHPFIQNSFSISSKIDGSPLYYHVSLSDLTTDAICFTVNISAASCLRGVCEVSISSLDLAQCPPQTNINVSVLAFNLLGNGPASRTIVGMLLSILFQGSVCVEWSSVQIRLIFTVVPWFTERTNQFVDVKFESRTRIVCSFSELTGTQNKSCVIMYGSCGQQLTMTVEGRSQSNSAGTVVINLPVTQTPSSSYCYIISTSNSTHTVKVQGMFSEYRLMIWTK